MSDLLGFLLPIKEKISCVAARHSVLQFIQSPDHGESGSAGRFLVEVDEMSLYRRFVKSLIEGLERGGRARVLRVLEGMEPKYLREHGYSPELLRKGISGWPWRIERPSERVAGPATDPLSLAEAELSAYTDAELDDLGISRSEIPDAVRHGRPGIDDVAA